MPSCRACVGAADRARVRLVGSNFRVIAASGGNGLLTKRVPLSLDGKRRGFHQDHSRAPVSIHPTRGYET